jgi:amidase
MMWQEMTGWKGFGVTTGWSALGGQTQSPYIVGGFKDGDKLLGHSVSTSSCLYPEPCIEN